MAWGCEPVKNEVTWRWLGGAGAGDVLVQGLEIPGGGDLEEVRVLERLGRMAGRPVEGLARRAQLRAARPSTRAAFR